MSRGVGSRMVRGATGFRAVSGASKPRLDLFSGGTFTRASDGTYLSDAGQLVTASSNVRRIESGMLLMEGSRTNFARNSAPPEVSAYWVTNSSAVFTTDSGPEFIAGLGAAKIDLAADAASRATTVFTVAPADSANICVSCWVRTVTGTGTVRLVLQDKAGAVSYGSDTPVTTDWQLLSMNVGAGVGAALPRLGVANGTDAAARSVYIAGMMGEVGVYWPSRHIDVPSATQVTRAADVLSYAVGEYPSSFMTTGFRFTFVPAASSAEMVAAGSSVGQMRLFGVNAGTNALLFEVSAGNVWLRGYASGSSKVSSASLTFSRNQSLAIACEPAAGRLTVSGASVGNGAAVGTGWDWSAANTTLTVGSAPASVTHAFGHFGQYIEAL